MPPPRPMLATAGRPPTGPGWAGEFKWDGVRALIGTGPGGVALTSRNGNDVTAGYPELTAGIPTGRPLLLDGEIVALDGAGRPDFGLLQQRMHVRHPSATLLAAVPVQLYVFDVLEIDGAPVTALTYDERRALLLGLGIGEWPAVSVTPSVTDVPPAEVLEVARAHGLEGIVAKKRSSRYEPGRRSAAWIKTAIFTTREVVVGGWTPGQGRRGGTLGALLLGAHDADGRLHYLGNVGTGFSDAALRTLLGLLEPLERRENPFADAVPREQARGARWVEPRLVGEVEYRTMTHDGRLRHSAWRGLRPDRDPSEITVLPAGAAATADERAALDALRAKGTWTVGGRELALTNLDKVLFAPNVTKRDLVRHYAVVAPYLVPYLVDRPVNLHRFPDGVGKEGFWQKEVPGHAPDWLRRWRYPDAGEGETQVYAVVDSTAALAWMGNLGAVELHPWTSTAADPHRPTWALIDIDPGPRASFDDVLVVARLYRTALEHLGVAAGPLVTGKRGVQIRIPVAQRHTFAETRGWVEKLSRAVGSMVPELVSWEWHTDRRDGLIRLDYTQNAVNRTLVAPFSTRAAPGAPVAVPLTWAELDDPELAPDRWTIRTLPARLASAGDPLAPLRGRDQELPAL
ncbi:DNA ligase D [Pseudonocardia ailaonensis]|uniref:DNA ligase D n=1 Tax=Pseudonocardia ailaonensis TaxID=367279 RepID=UPI0031D17549